MRTRQQEIKRLKQKVRNESLTWDQIESLNNKIRMHYRMIKSGEMYIVNF